jgi:hypothetical protein
MPRADVGYDILDLAQVPCSSCQETFDVLPVGGLAREFDTQVLSAIDVL